jgi:hypothetical protein
VYRVREDKRMEDRGIGRWSHKDVCRIRSRGGSEFERETFRKRPNGENDGCREKEEME